MYTYKNQLESPEYKSFIADQRSGTYPINCCMYSTCNLFFFYGRANIPAPSVGYLILTLPLDFTQLPHEQSRLRNNQKQLSENGFGRQTSLPPSVLPPRVPATITFLMPASLDANQRVRTTRRRRGANTALQSAARGRSLSRRRSEDGERREGHASANGR